MSTSSEQTIHVGDLLLDTNAKSVRLKEEVLPLSPTSFDLLHCLMLQSPNVVSVDEILKNVWKDKVVNKESVKQQIKALRNQLGEAKDLVQSVRGFGYKISAPQTERITNAPPVKNPTKEKHWFGAALICLVVVGMLLWSQSKAPFQPQIPLIVAVLPFQSVDNQTSALPLLLQDELTTMLSRQPLVKAMAVSTVSNALQQQYSHQQFAEELGVHMLFEGSIRMIESGFQVNIRMVWTGTGVAVWRDTIEVHSEQREVLINKVRDALQPFINKKVAYIQEKLDNP